MVRSFAAIDFKKPLPPITQFLDELVARSDGKEQTIAAWCATQSISFFSPANTLQTAIAAGNQIYFTYDQHWTPAGHEAFARALHDFLTQQGLPKWDEPSVR